MTSFANDPNEANACQTGRTVGTYFSDEQLLLTAEQAAKALCIGRTTLYALLKDGELRAVQLAAAAGWRGRS